MLGISRLINFFEKAAAPPVKITGPKPLVNYIWINPEQVIDAPENPECAINLGNIKRAINNANSYPMADFNLWIDKKLMGAYSLSCIEAFISKHAQSANIQIHDLQDIANYRKDPYFIPLKPGQYGYVSAAFNDRSSVRNVYSRADYARMLVLEHCMETMPDRTRIIYSDIDCRDIKLGKALRRMDEFGVAIYNMGKDISHGYIGLASDNPLIKKHFPGLKVLSCHAAHMDWLTYEAFNNYLDDLGMPHDKWRHKIGIRRLLPRMHSQPRKVTFKMQIA